MSDCIRCVRAPISHLSSSSAFGMSVHVLRRLNGMFRNFVYTYSLTAITPISMIKFEDICSKSRLLSIVCLPSRIGPSDIESVVDNCAA